VLKPEATGQVEVEDLKSHMRKAVDAGQLPKYGLPDRYLLVDALPKTSVGKLDKKVLRQGYR
jgi:fatty-acyl-CoA synthase